MLVVCTWVASTKLKRKSEYIRPRRHTARVSRSARSGAAASATSSCEPSESETPMPRSSAASGHRSGEGKRASGWPERRTLAQALLWEYS